MRRQKKLLAVASLLCASAAFSGVALGLGDVKASADVPEAVTSENVALGKTAEYRSFDDFSQTVETFDYWVDATGYYEYTGNKLTDGVVGWANSSVLSAIKGTTFTEANNLPNLANMAWAYIDLEASYLIDSVGLAGVDTWVFNKPVIQLSNDGENWVTVFSGADKLYDSEGNEIYSDGYVNVERHKSMLWDLSAHDLKSHSILSSVAVDGVWTFEFDAMTARYVRATGMLSGHTTSGDAQLHNTVFSEVQVNAISQGVMAPNAKTKAGTYASLDKVELTTPYDNAKIYYTTDGSYPTTSASLYADGIDVSSLGEKFTIRAITELADGGISLPVSYTYVVGMFNTNVAAGKDAEFRSFDDFSQKVDMYDAWVDLGGINGTGCRELTGNHMTDGTIGWATSNVLNAVMGNTLDAVNQYNQANMAWAYIDLGASYNIDRVKLFGVNTWVLNKPVVQVSTDGTTWKTVFSGANKLYDSNGNAIYTEGFVNIEGAGCSIWDLSGHALESKSFNGAAEDTSWPISFTATSARYVRVTGMHCDHTSGGTSNNTMFSEIQVFTPPETATAPVEETAITKIDAGKNGGEVENGTTKEEVVATFATTATLTDNAGKSYTVDLTWDCENYDGTVAGDYTFTASYILPANVINVYEVAAPTAKVTVKIAVSITALEEAMVEARQLVADSYTASSFVAVTEKIAAAEELLKGEYTQENVDSAKAAIDGAVAALVARGDKAALEGKIAEYEGKDLTAYTATTAATLRDAIQNAKDYVAETAVEEMAKADVDAFLATLDTANGGLVAVGDKTALSEAIAQAKALVAADYTAATMAKVTEAVTAAEAVVANGDALQADVDGAKAALEEAIAGLISVKDLAVAVATAEEKKAADYTSASYATLTTAIGNAKVVLAKADATAEEIDDAKAALDEAVAALVQKGDKAALEALVAECAALAESDYAAGWNTFVTALVDASAVLDDEDATQEVIDGAKAALEEAKAGLQEKAPATSDSANDSDGASAGFGCVASVGSLAATAMLTLLGAGAIAIKRKH